MATKRDLDQQRELSSRDLKLVTQELRSETRSMGSGLELRIEVVRTDLLTQQRNFMLTLMAMNGATAVLVVAAVRLL